MAKTKEAASGRHVSKAISLTLKKFCFSDHTEGAQKKDPKHRHAGTSTIKLHQ